jgi:hypothetical protein
MPGTAADCLAPAGVDITTVLPVRHCPGRPASRGRRRWPVPAHPDRDQLSGWDVPAEMHHVIPAQHLVIPAQHLAIPAQAGIQSRAEAISSTVRSACPRAGGNPKQQRNVSETTSHSGSPLRAESPSEWADAKESSVTENGHKSRTHF